MASVRVLSASELGAIRFTAAQNENTWPVEFKLRDGANGAAFGRAPDPPSCVVSPSNGASESVTLARAARGEWRTVISLPEGTVGYELHRAGSVAASGQVDVRAPDGPLENSKLGSTLKVRVPSGARQQATRVDYELEDSGFEATWPVRFVYAEPSFGVREVWVEPVDSQPARCVKETNADGHAVFVGQLNLTEGMCNFRYRVVLNEACPAHCAPFTRLGWDAGASHSGGLTTWEFSVQIKNLEKLGAVPGSCVMTHEKSVVPEVVRADSLQNSSATPGTCSIVREAVSLLDKSAASTDAEKLAGDKTRGKENVPHPCGRADVDLDESVSSTVSASTTELAGKQMIWREKSNDRRVCKGQSVSVESSDVFADKTSLRLGARSKVWLLSGIALSTAAALVAIIVKGASRDSDDEDLWEDFGGDRSVAELDSGADPSASDTGRNREYFSHAKSQSW